MECLVDLRVFRRQISHVLMLVLIVEAQERSDLTHDRLDQQETRRRRERRDDSSRSRFL